MILDEIQIYYRTKIGKKNLFHFSGGVNIFLIFKKKLLLYFIMHKRAYMRLFCKIKRIDIDTSFVLHNHTYTYRIYCTVHGSTILF